MVIITFTSDEQSTHCWILCVFTLSVPKIAKMLKKLMKLYHLKRNKCSSISFYYK